MSSISTKYHKMEEILRAEYTAGPYGMFATKMISMYNVARKIDNVVILELGTAKGGSATVFLQACEDAGGRLVSVDVKDCSDISDSERWSFVRSDSAAVDKVIASAPHLADGIDVLYVDSLHEKTHVEKELLGWYPYLNAGAHIFFDDVDSRPYHRGQRKDNFGVETKVDEIRNYVLGFFYANEDDLFLDMMFGGTGLAHIYKLAPKGASPEAPASIVRRNNGIANRLKHRLKALVSSKR